ncbi:D-glycero-D-manno-heptose 1,7-bisphosphate phosphatase [Janthinobacterium sp. 35]|nr:D-glycero-D-manno-heptose 1,7-bisphosphate phosphatase [Janthinobacterium sp. 35]
MMGMPALKLIILDRDGVINHDSPDFIKSPAEWLPIPGSLEAIARLNQAGYRVVVASNQSGIAREYFDMTVLNAIHQKMHTLAQQVGADIDAIFFCPHAGADNCDCRKPKPGMFHEISKRYNTSLKGVPTVGDSLRDLQAGFISGCVPYLVLTGKGEKTNETGGLPPGTQVFPDLAAVVSHLLKAPAASAPSVAFSI